MTEEKFLDRQAGPLPTLLALLAMCLLVWVIGGVF